MARPIQDEKQMMQSSITDQPEQGMPGPSVLSTSIQLQISEEFQRSLVQTIKADWDSAREARDSKDYGWNDKGEKLTFEKFFKDLKDLYNARRIPKTIPWKFCYSKDTEILTKAGWKLVKDLSVVDLVFSINPLNRKASWMPVISTLNNYYENLIHFKGKSIDLLVSEDHQMLVEDRNGKLFFESAKILSDHKRGRYIPLVSEFDSSNHPTQLNGFNSEDWMEFLGWYISEGFTYKSGTVSICQDDQVNPGKCEKIRELFCRMKLDFSYSSNKQFLIKKRCFSKSVREELIETGKAENKKIPASYLNLSPALLQKLFEVLLLGDGTRLRREGKTDLVNYYTSSYQLANQVQEIAQKIGIRATVSVMHEAGTEFEFSNGRYAIKNDVLVVRILNKKRVQCNKLKSEIVSYQDYAYCLETPYHTVLVRRNGKAVWCGNCSNRSLRIAASILDLLHSKIFSAVINEEFIRWKAMGLEDVPKKERIEKLMRWWIFSHSKLYPFWDNWVKLITGYGDGLTETSWNRSYTDTGKTESQPVMDEAGAQLIEATGEPSVSRSHIVKPTEITTSHTYIKDQYFLQAGSQNIESEPVILEDTYFYRELEEGEADQQFVNVQTILRNKIPYEKPNRAGLDPEEENRLQDLKLRNAPVKILKWYGNFDYDGDGFAENVRVFISPEHDVYLGGVKVADLTYSGKRPLNFTKYDNRIDRPYDNDGEGVLEKVKELALEVDAIFNQISDANTLSVMRPFFYDPSGDLDAPVLTLGPNKGTPITDPTRNVMFPDIRIPIDQLINAIRLVLEFIERLTAASSYVLGRESEIVGGSGTATRTNAIIQSAQERFTIPMNRLREGAARILKNHLDILQLNIPPGLDTRILGENGEPLFGQNELSQEGISGEFDCYLVSNPALGSQSQERELAGALYATLLQNPIVASNPYALYVMTAKLIKAYGLIPEEILGPAPDMDMIDDPSQENTLMIQGDFKRVVPQMTENHLFHIQKHMELMQSPSMAVLPPHLLMQVQQYAQAHIEQHMQMMQTMIGIQGKFGGGSNVQNQIGGGETSAAGEPEGASQSAGMAESSPALQGAMSTKREGQSGFNT